MIRRVIACLALLAATSAHADTIGLHVASWHSVQGYNNFNPGAYWQGDSGATVGAYCNSESRSRLFPDAKRCDMSAYAGWTFTYGIFSATAGVITGYRRGPTPMVLPTVKLGDHLRVGFVPKIDPKTGSHVIHAMWEF